MRKLVLTFVLCACSTRTHELASSSVDASTRSDAGHVIALCGSAPCACSNGLDDDGDGLIDGFDPECTSPSDQFEDSFATGVHGEDQDQKCQDCFFDQNSGHGDDGCSRARSCATDGTASGGNGSCNQCAVDSQCSASCAPLAPNGCDCFGCCGVFQGGTEVFILLTDSCSVALLDQPSACTRCVQASDCLNPCGRCELCPGRRASDLPADCAVPGGRGYSCDQSAVCGSDGDCSGGEFCQQGCCLAVGI